jgi:ABC-type multidrug transport system fused ATPase/permease subunit
LLERWYNPQSGTILLDGTNIDQVNLKWLRTNIRLVQQVFKFLASNLPFLKVAGTRSIQWNRV